jgi:hypothetical protein
MCSRACEQPRVSDMPRAIGGGSDAGIDVIVGSGDATAWVARAVAHLAASELTLAQEDLTKAKALLDQRPRGSLEPYTPRYYESDGSAHNPGAPNTLPDPHQPLAGEIEAYLGGIARARGSATGSAALLGLARLHFRWSNRLAPSASAAARAKGCAASWEALSTTHFDSHPTSLSFVDILEPMTWASHPGWGDGHSALLEHADGGDTWTIFVPTSTREFLEISAPYPSQDACRPELGGFDLKSRRDGRWWIFDYQMRTGATHVPPQCTCPLGDSGQLWQGNASLAPCADPQCGPRFCDEGLFQGLRSITFVDPSSNTPSAFRVLLDSEDTESVRVTVDATSLHIRGGECAVNVPLRDVQK